MDRLRMCDSRIFVIGMALSLLSFAVALQGCESNRHMVLAATGTNIGVEISQNPATQSPQAKLGYQRMELAIVPTNRSSLDTASTGNSLQNGAKDLADVVMEIRYGGIFDMGPSSGIYQRLAVGRTAVTQPGASFMFAKDSDGKLDSATVSAVERAHLAVQQVTQVHESVESEKAAMRQKFEGLYAANHNDPALQKFEIAAQSVGYSATGHSDYPAFRNFMGDVSADGAKAGAVRKSLESQGVKF